MARERYEATDQDIIQLFGSVAREYFQLPSYVGKSNLYDQQTETQKIFNDQADAWHTDKKMRAWAEARKGNYSKAINMMYGLFNELKGKRFSEHDTNAIQIMFLRRLGKIYEHWATFGEKDKPLTDQGRRSHFIHAAFLYMLSDLQLGVMTEFASRAAESLRGAGFGELVLCYRNNLTIDTFWNMLY